MTNSATGQVIRSAAQVYDEFFVPALFGEWTDRVADAAMIKPGQRVLDVACGTGALTRTISERAGPSGFVAGVDINDGMLAVARANAPEITWDAGQAEALPAATGCFDAVVSQFGLMFFEDQPAALREMMRVLRPGGRLAVAVWDSLGHTPGYAAMTGLLRRLFGDDVAQSLHAPYTLGDLAVLNASITEAGISDAQITTHTGTARFPSIASWVYTDIQGWTLAGTLDDEQFNLLSREAEKTLHPFVTTGGTVAFDAPAHIVTARKPD